MKPLAVTGLGVVSPLGNGRERFFAALRDVPPGGAFRAPTLFDAAQYAGASVAEVRDFDPAAVLGDKGLRNLDRLTKLFLVASRGAAEDAGVKKGGEYLVYGGQRVGVCGSTAYGSLEAVMELDRVALLEDPRYLNPSKFPNTVINAALGYVSIWDDYRALNATVCNGNCGAMDAVLCAETYLESGRADAILVGGAEAMHEALYLAFDRLGSLAHADGRFAPGDARSAGMRLGEGAVLATLERDEAARARGARVLGHIVGYGTAFEPPESEALIVHVSPESVERAVESALADAGITARDIDVVATTANGMPSYDGPEMQALGRVFGDGVCVVAPKAIFGETLGASAAFAMGTVLAWFDGAPVAPVLRGATTRDPSTVLVTALGFYGNASAVVMRRPGA